LLLLSNACESGDLAAVKELLPKVPRTAVNVAVQPHTSPPLTIAVHRGHLAIVAYLLEHTWVDIDTQDDDKISPRIAAVGSPNAVEMVTFMLDHPRFQGSFTIDTPDESGVSLIGQACVRGNLEVIKLLLARGANPKQRQVNLGDSGELGETCLHLAAQSGNVEAVKAMVEAGLTLDVLDCNQRTAIFSAVKYGMLNVVKWLVEMGVDLNWVDLVGLTPRDYADSIGMHQLAIYLARNGAQTQRSSLRQPRGFVAQWSRLWPYGDIVTPRNQPQLTQIGKYIYISGGWSDSENFDSSECFRLHLDTIRPTSLKTILEPKLRPFSLSSKKKGEHLVIFEHISDAIPEMPFTAPSSSSMEASSSSGSASDGSSLNITPITKKAWRVKCDIPDTCSARYSSVMFETPYQVRKGTVAYYEVKIIQMTDSGVVAIGMVPEDFTYQTALPGWSPNSYAYHSDDGASFTQDEPVYWGPAVYQGDTFGVGIHWDSGCVFYTYNGAFLGPIHKKDIGSKPLYGCIGLIGKGTTAEINFGAEESVSKFSELTSIQKHPWLFNFEVMAIKSERCVPNVAPVQGSAIERRMILLHEFPRLAMALGPYLVSLEPLEAFAYFLDTRTNDLFKLPYETASPLDQNVEMLQIAVSGDKLYGIDFSPGHSFQVDNPGYELSEVMVEAVVLSILDLKTRSWSVATVSLAHFKERPLLDIAASHVPLEDNKLWFLNSPNCPFYIDLLQMRAFRYSSQSQESLLLASDPTSISANRFQTPSGKSIDFNLWQAGTAFARIPSDEQLSKDIEEASRGALPLPLSQTSNYETWPWNGRSTIAATLEAIQPHLVPWNGQSDLRSQMPQPPRLPEPATLRTWKPSLGRTDAEYEYELANALEEETQTSEEVDAQNEASGGFKASSIEPAPNTQLVVFGGMPKVTREAAERHLSQAQERAAEEDLEIPSHAEVYSKGQVLLSSDLYFFLPKTREWVVPRVQGFLPTPKGQSDLIYIGGGRLIGFGGGNSTSVMPSEIEMLTLNASFSTDDKLGVFFNNPLCSDFEIVFPASNGTASETVKAHKAILIARSHFFQKVLSSPLPSTLLLSRAHDSSSDANRPEDIIPQNFELTRFEVPVQEVQYFRLMLQYLYSDTVPSDLLADSYCGFLDLVEMHFPEHLARLSELLLLNHLTADSRSTMASLGALLSDPHGLALADVQVNVEGGSPIMCHKVVLCARSDYFKALFGGSMVEGQKGVATIENIPYRVCFEIVRYLYTLTLNLDVLEEMVVDVLIWSNALSISDLYASVESIVISNLAAENVDYLLEIANAHHLPKLASECDRFKNSPTELLFHQQGDVDLELSAPKEKRKCTSELMEAIETMDFNLVNQGNYLPDENDTESVRQAKEVMRVFANFAMNAAGAMERLLPHMAAHHAEDANPEEEEGSDQEGDHNGNHNGDLEDDEDVTSGPLPNPPKKRKR
jgi:ankyrin repeat protein